MMSSEGFGTYIAIVVILLFVLCAVCTAPLSVSITMYIIVGLVVNVLLPCPTLHLLFPLCLVTVLVPVFISYNCLYGTSHCKSYFCDHIAIGNLVREIPLYSHFHPSFQPQWTEINCISCCIFIILWTCIFAPLSVCIPLEKQKRELRRSYVLFDSRDYHYTNKLTTEWLPWLQTTPKDSDYGSSFLVLKTNSKSNLMGSCPIHLTTTIHALTILRTSVKESSQMHYKVAARNFHKGIKDVMRVSMQCVDGCKMNWAVTPWVALWYGVARHMYRWPRKKWLPP